MRRTEDSPALSPPQEAGCVRDSACVPGGVQLLGAGVCRSVGGNSVGAAVWRVLLLPQVSVYWGEWVNSLRTAVGEVGGFLFLHCCV